MRDTSVLCTLDCLSRGRPTSTPRSLLKYVHADEQIDRQTDTPNSLDVRCTVTKLDCYDSIDYREMDTVYSSTPGIFGKYFEG